MGYQEIPAHALVWDAETILHRDFTRIMGIDEKVAAAEDMDLQDLIDLAEDEDIKLGNRNKIESIRPFVQDSLRKTARRGAMKMYGCEIVAIGVGGINSPKVTAWATDEEHTEEDVLKTFMEALHRQPTMLVGFNIRDFDIPVLRARCIALGIPWPDYLPQNKFEDRVDRTAVFDIRDVLAEGPLDTWLKMLGLPPKTARGSLVANMSPEERRQYVADDVERERRLARIVMRQQRNLAVLIADDD